MNNHGLQLETMRLYRSLVNPQGEWGGKLVLLTDAGSSAASAVSIAGGASLTLGCDSLVIKTAQRSGYLDFVVNSLDEAMRALKNEVRQKRSLSVGLIADISVTLAEMDERGIVPDARLGSEANEPYSLSSDEHYFPAHDATSLRATDAALLAVMPADDLTRRRWVERAPQFLREARTGGRWIWLRESELAPLAEQGITPARRP